MDLVSDLQQQIATLEAKIFLEGITGTGKTTIGVMRLAHLLRQGVPAHEIMVFVPQKTLGLPYQQLLDDPTLPARGEVRIETLGSIGREWVDLFWVLIAEEAGFAHPERRPTFLSLETAQYYMARIVQPLIEQRGFFDTVTIDRNRLYSQILDNLNKAAIVPFSHREIGERLKAAMLIRDEAQRRVYEDVQACASEFRQYCLEHSLIDFSLQTELMRRLWKTPQVRRYFQTQHLIFDNAEEDTPVTHDLMFDWIEQCETALVIYDQEAGYRRFLGADPVSAYRLRDACDRTVRIQESLVTHTDLEAFGCEIAVSLERKEGGCEGDPRAPLQFESRRYHPQMIDWVADEIAGLVKNEGVSPNEIVVIGPYLSDALRFSLMSRLDAHGVPSRSHRPSRSLREEPASLCLLTLAQLAHTQWQQRPALLDVAYALMTAIQGLDLTRAQLLAQVVYHDGKLSGFDQIRPEMQERITYVFGQRYDVLRQWLNQAQTQDEIAIDHFWSRLFGEVLSLEGFGFHHNFDAAQTAANLIDSARNFRLTITIEAPEKSQSQEYVEMVAHGIIADQYLRNWDLETVDAVLIAPAYTFLMRNTPVDYQFWINVGGGGWSERLYQPLTHPYVLTREWEVGRVWTDVDEVETSQDGLYRLILGLIRRCRKRINLGWSELGEQGYEQRGALLDAIQRMFKRLANENKNEGENINERNQDDL
ncbi:MAG: hypothetical protein MUF87_22230 [Anaerolineae bacterium]|jgi:hypothetical protein|nr:hypothetical protein [Anaerolineae bacterium]